MNLMHVMVIGTQAETLRLCDAFRDSGMHTVTQFSDGRRAAERLCAGEVFGWIFLEEGDAQVRAMVGRALKSSGAQVAVTTLSHVTRGAELASCRANVCAIGRTGWK